MQDNELGISVGCNVSEMWGIHMDLRMRRMTSFRSIDATLSSGFRSLIRVPIF